MQLTIPAALVVLLTVLAAWGDAEGFVHASRTWNEYVVWPEVGKAAAGFTFGNAAYLLAQPLLYRLGVRAPELQTVGWFGVTIVLVALISRRFATWDIPEQCVALIVVAGVVWLLVRVPATISS